MIDEKLLGRITANPQIFGGKPIIRGMRISVETILSLLAQVKHRKLYSKIFLILNQMIYGLVWRMHMR